MVTYQYRCRECKQVAELKFPIGEMPEEIECPKCKGQAKKIIGACSFILTGPGDAWPSQQNRRKQDGLKKNERAGKNMRERWKSRMPKLAGK